MQSYLYEQKSENIKNGLKKILFQKLFEFSQTFNGLSADSFKEIIESLLNNQLL